MYKNEQGDAGRIFVPHVIKLVTAQNPYSIHDKEMQNEKKAYKAFPSKGESIKLLA